MAGTRDLKKRIKSVKNTQKITQAMKMVAAAKVKKAENFVKASRPFTNELIKAFERLMGSNPSIEGFSADPTKPLSNFPALLETREVKTVGLLMITSDRGLAGAYNSNVVRRTIARIRELYSEGKNVKLFITGTKGVNAFKRVKCDVVNTYTRLPVTPTQGSAHIIAEDIAELFVKKEIDSIELFTTAFKSMLSYQVQQWQVLPLKIDSLEEKELKCSSDMIFEPSPEAVLQKMVPLYITNRIFQALTEASASELAARMAAMSAATKNAGEMIQHLTTVYNKARQASITQELLEVVSGADALSK